MVRPFLHLALLAAPALGPAALAAEPVELVDGGPITADGQPVDLQIWSPAITPESKLQVKVGGRRIEELKIGEGGLARFRWSPPSDSQRIGIPVEVRVRGPGGQADATLSLDLVPAGTAPLQIRFEPEILTLGTDEAAKVWIEPPESGQDLSDRRFSVHSSTGIIDALTPVGDGRFVARWTPPQKLAQSQVVLFMVSEDNRPDTVVGAAALPVQVATTVRLDAPAGSTNILTAAGRRYGPFAAGADGKVVFEVTVDPRNPAATLETAVGGQTTSRPVVLPLAEGARLTFAPPPAGLPADPEQRFPVWAYGLVADGTPLEVAPDLSVDRGSISGARAGPVPGTYVAEYTPADSPGPVQVTARAQGVEVHRRTKLVKADAPRVSLVFDPPALEEGTTQLSITATVKTPTGQAVTGNPPRIELAGARLVGRPVDKGDGSYVFQARREGSGPVLAVVIPPLEPSGLPAARLLAWAGAGSLGEGEQVVLLLAATDAFGQPVPGVEIKVQAEGGSIAPQTRTGPGGLASLPLVRTGPGAVKVQAEGAGLRTELLLLPEPPERKEPPPAGSEADQARLARWLAIAPGAILGQTRPEAVIASAPTPAPTAAPAPSPGPSTSAPAARTGPSSPARVPRPSPTEGPDIRLSLAAFAGNHGYAMESDDGQDVPEEASFETGFGVPGLEFQGVGWVIPSLAIDARLRAWREVLDAAGEEVPSLSLDFAVGGRYGMELLPALKVYGVGQLHRLSAPVFEYDNEPRTEVAVERPAKMGPRIGLGGILQAGPVFARLEAAESFLLAPSVHQLELELAYALQESIALRLGTQLEKRSLRYELGGAEVEVEDDLVLLSLGATWVLP